MDILLELLENDYKVFEKKLTLESDKQKKDFIVGAMAYIYELKERIK